MNKSKLTISENKIMCDLRTLIVKHGYWSDEVKQLNSSLDYNTMVKLNNIIKN